MWGALEQILSTIRCYERCKTLQFTVRLGWRLRETGDWSEWLSDLRNLMELRKTLHRTAYQHKTVKKLEQQHGKKVPAGP